MTDPAGDSERGDGITPSRRTVLAGMAAAGAATWAVPTLITVPAADVQGSQPGLAEWLSITNPLPEDSPQIPFTRVGATWNPVAGPFGDGGDPYLPYGISAVGQIAVMVGADNRWSRSIDGGTSWTQGGSMVGQATDPLWCVNSVGTDWAAAGGRILPDAVNRLWASVDSGATWNAAVVNNPPPVPFVNITGTADGTWIAVTAAYNEYGTYWVSTTGVAGPYERCFVMAGAEIQQFFDVAYDASTGVWWAAGRDVTGGGGVGYSALWTTTTPEVESSWTGPLGPVPSPSAWVHIDVHPVGPGQSVIMAVADSWDSQGDGDPEPDTDVTAGFSRAIRIVDGTAPGTWARFDIGSNLNLTDIVYGGANEWVVTSQFDGQYAHWFSSNDGVSFAGEANDASNDNDRVGVTRTS